MAYTDYIDTVQKLYIAYYQRPADPAGLRFWAEKLDEANGDIYAIINDFANSSESLSLYGDITKDNIGSVVDHIYMAAFNRHAEGIDDGSNWYVHQFNEGKLTAGQIAFQILNGAQNEDLAVLENKLEAANLFTETIDPNLDLNPSNDQVAYSGEDDAQAVRDWLATVTDAAPDQEDVVSFIKEKLADDNAPVMQGKVFTLTGAEEVTQEAKEPELMWGYTPENAEVGEGKGIPVSDLLNFLTNITGLDFKELGLIDDDGVDPQGNLTLASLTISGLGANAQELTIKTDDGHVFTAEASLGEDYMNFLKNFFYDEDGNSRLYISDEVEEETENVPIVLTPTQNNGGTFEKGFTTDNDDIIIAGRTELLHRAYIDAGGGEDTLEVDMKGVYAQPLQLRNIEHIKVQNLPNVYNEDGDYIGTAGNIMPDNPNSILDLSRATDIETLTISEGTDTGAQLGDLTIVGIRNGVKTILRGNFTQDVNLHYAYEGLEDGVNLVLDLGNVADNAALNVAHNSSTLNIESIGSANVLKDANLGQGTVTALNITGDAELYIMDNIAGAFYGGHPISIDASGNTAGVDLTIDDFDDEINFVGTDADDHFNVNNNGKSVVVNTGAGNDEISAKDDQTVIINAGEGNDEVTVDNSEAVTVILGDGQSTVSADGVNELNIEAGDGGNTVSAIGVTKADIQTGSGADIIKISAEEINIDAGAGNDIVTIAGTLSSITQPDGTTPGALNLMLILDDSGSMQGDRLAALKDAVNAMFDEIEKSGINTAAITIVFGSDARSSGWGTIEEARNVINALQGNSGGTNYEKALDTAMAAFKEQGALNNALNLGVFITDGTGNNIDNNKQTEWETFLKNNKIVCHAVGIGDLNNTAPLEPIAYDGVNGTQIDPVLATNFTLQDVLTDIAQENVVGNEALINVDLGAGENTLYIGDADQLAQGLIAYENSVIKGEDIKLVINADTDLHAVDMEGISSVVLDNGLKSADVDTDNAQLTLTDAQFAEIGAENFSVEGSKFDASGIVKIIVTESTSLSDLGVEGLPSNIDLQLELKDGVTLEMTAEQLHKYVAEDGVILGDKENDDLPPGKVVIKDAGLDFDPFADNVGSLSDDFVGVNYVIEREVDGFNRPDDELTGSRLLINTDETPNIGPFQTTETYLRIEGNSGLKFQPVEGGYDEWGRPVEGGDAIELGVDPEGVEDKPFVIDYSNVGGEVKGLTVARFNDVEAVFGNGNDTVDARLNVKLEGDVASPDQGLVSKGVTEFVVVETDGNSGDGYEFYTCETTQDLETLGIQGWLDDTVKFMNTERGVNFLIETEYSKANGYGSSDMYAEFARDGADAVINVVALDAVPAEEEQVIGDIEVVNADTVTFNITGGDTIITTFDGNEATNLTITADADVIIDTIEDSANLDSIDASGIAGDFTMSSAHTGDDAFTFIGSEGTTHLTLTANADFNADSSFTAAGDLNVIVDDGSDNAIAVDFTDADISGVDSITIGNNDKVIVGMDQADAIGAANFHVLEGNTASLDLEGLNDQEFALANYNVDGTLNISVTLANEPVVTLNPNTDLSGINDLVIPDGTTLKLTMEQFQELNGNGTITDAGIGHLVITDVTQASVGEYGADLDLSGLDLDGADSTVTLEFAESVDLTEAKLDGKVDTYSFGDDMTLTFGDFDQIDGVTINGGDNSIVVINDIAAPKDGIDASNWNFSEVHFLNIVASNVENVDKDLFVNIPESVEKIIYNGEGVATPVSQEVTVEAQTSIDGNYIAFNKAGEDQDTVEITDFTLNLEGGVYIAGDVVLSTDKKINPETGKDLLTHGLQVVTINSTGTEANLLNNETANVIEGALTPLAHNVENVNNTLINVNINADQNLQIKGGIVFNSWSDGDYDDGWTINDNDAADATVTINGTADVNLGTIDSSDDDVDSVTINNTGSGNVYVTVDSNKIDDDAANDNVDELAFTGSNINLTVSGDVVDLSDDDLSGVSTIAVDDSDLTISFAQLNTIGVANITGNDNLVDDNLIINGYDGSAFDFTTIDEDIEDVTLITDGSAITLDAATDLTGVTEINANGGSITMTATQFQQLEGAGKIINASNVTITDLTQAVIDAGPFDLSSVQADSVVVQVSEDINLSADDNIENATEVQIGSHHLGLATHDQADDLVVTGDSTSSVSLLFDIDYGRDGEIEASGYHVGTVRAIAETVAGLDVEVVFDNLPNSVTLNLFETPEEVGYVSPIYRHVIIEDGVAVPADLIFNGQDDTREMRTLTIDFEGDANDGRTVLEDQDHNLEGSVITGDLILDHYPNDPELTPIKLQTLTLNSFGDGDSNAIIGDINPLDSDGPGPNEDNNLLDVVINADSDFTIRGDIIFSSTDADDATATLTINGAADVSVNQLDVSDLDVDALVVNNNGTGTLTVTGDSPAIVGPVETVTFAGTGDIVLGTIGEGVSDDTISVIDATGLSGDLTMDVVEDIDDADFTFKAGSGVTTMIYSEDDDIAAFDADTAPGITLDFSNAAPGSELHLDTDIQAEDKTSKFTVLADEDTTIYIDTDIDLSDFDASLPVGSTIVVADDVTLTLTATQASGLTIVAGPDVDDNGYNGNVEIVELGDYIDADGNGSNDDPAELVDYDFSHIAVPAFVTLADDDVTISEGSDLGSVVIVLNDVDNPNELAGQTIRFSTEDQAARTIRVNDNSPVDPRSTNVVWLFDNITQPVDTSNYDKNIARLWMGTDLINGQGGDVENLYTTLPNSILRVDFGDLTELNILLNSSPVDREMEITNFNTLGDLTFSDISDNPEEHIQSLTLKLGGEVTVGNIDLDDIINDPAAYDADSVNFNYIAIESHRAVKTGDLLASEGFVNDNDGINEPGETAQPANINTVGDISGHSSHNIDLLDVRLDTGEVTHIGDDSSGEGADLKVGTITFETDTPDSTATLTVSGANKITVAGIDTSDPDITTFVLNTSGLTGAFDPVANLDNTESFIITDNGTEGGLVLFDDVQGNELSEIVVNADDAVTLTLSELDSNDDDINGDGTPDQAAFTYIAGTGVNHITLAAVGSNIPTLEAGSTWNFNMRFADEESTLILDESVVFEDGANLKLTNIPNLIIEGNVDLSNVNLDITNPHDLVIEVGAGDTLTLTAEQADELEIHGAGTVNIVDGALNLDVDLSNIMTDEGDTGTVTLAISTADDADVGAGETPDPDTDPEDLVFTGDLGVAKVIVSGEGSLTLNDRVVITGYDRDDDGTIDTQPSFVVDTNTTLNLNATQADGLSITGAGATSVTIDEDTRDSDADADLSGITTTGGVDAIVAGNTTFTGNLGTADVTVNDGVTLTVAYDLITGHAVNEQNAPAGTGELDVLLDPEQDVAADLSTITGDMEVAQRTAVIIGSMTFTGNFNGYNVELDGDRDNDGTDTNADNITLTASADRLNGLNVTGVDNGGSNDTLAVVVTDLAANLNADLDGITNMDSITATFDATGEFTGTLPAGMVVTVADDVVMTSSATNLTNAIAIVETPGEGNDGQIAAKVYADGAALDLNELDDDDNPDATEATLASITVVEDLTFTGTLHTNVATQVADGVTMTFEDADTVDNHEVNAAGTTGAVVIDGTTYDNDDGDGTLTLNGSANFTVNNLGAGVDLDATGVTGDLSVVTDNADVTIALGQGDNNIDANALDAGNTVTITGEDTTATVTTENGNIDATGVTNNDSDVTTGGLVLIGGEGPNNIIGGDNNDILRGGANDDILTGGAGNDTFIVDADTDTITDLTNGDNFQVSGAANAIIPINGTFIATDSTTNTSTGTVTLNIVDDGLGLDMSLAGGTAGYTINGSPNDDVIIGSGFDDIIEGGFGEDDINGGGGDDTITGGAGPDTITGGAGNDIFTYTAVNEFGDTITDFDNTGSGDDAIHLDADPAGLFASAFNGATKVKFITGVSVGTASVASIQTNNQNIGTKIFGAFTNKTAFTNRLKAITTGVSNNATYIALALNTAGTKLWIAKAAETGGAGSDIDAASVIGTIAVPAGRIDEAADIVLV